MGRMYTVSFAAVAVTAVQDLFSFKPADDKPIKLWGVNVAVVGGTADAGDAQEELLAISIKRAATTVGSGGSAPTPRPTVYNDVAAAFTARANDTVQATGGSPLTVFADGWNSRIPYQLFLLPEMALLDAQVGATESFLVVSLDTAPNDSISVSGTAWVEEII